MTPKQHDKHRWDDTPRYRSWVKQRDRALEKLHTRAQLEASDIMRKLLTDVLVSAKANFGALRHNQWGGLDSFEHYLKQHFNSAAAEFYKIITELRRRSYVLAKASESEIIAQLSRKPVYASITHSQLHQVMHKDTAAGGALVHRINLYLDRMRRKIVSMAQASALVTEDPKEFLIDVMSAFPRSKRVIRPKRILKPALMEAIHNIGEDDVTADIAIDNIDEQSWNDMLDAYMADYVPKYRGPEYVVDITTKDGDNYYAWEFERDMTQEFVQSVRDGQIEAANENGITDFVWIAIVDDRTDECCLWRDGLLVSEIEAQLDDHQEEDSNCDVEEGLTPPIHFNCRCTLAPATADIPDKPDDLSKDFDDWLNS